jgi:hypothetical protein
MGHLNLETLARLVDDIPELKEAEHIASCEACASRLEALRDQTEQLRSLPELVPPQGDWQVLEAKLRSEGLIRDPGLFARLGLAETPSWMRAAAAIVIFLGGTGFGAVLTSHGASQRMAALEGEPIVQESATSTQDAAERLRRAEQTYVNALAHYREVAADQGGDASRADPRSRFAALEYLVAASQAAVRQAPTDPFLNGLLASTLAEREATLRRISTQQQNWF